jgi:UPF0755 protein
LEFKKKSSSAMARAFRVFVITTLLGLAAIGFLAFKFFTYPERFSGTAQGRVEFTIAKGASAGQVAANLGRAGLLQYPTLFRLYAGQRGAASRFKPGHYEINAPATPRALIDLLVKGVVDELIAVTVPEGKNMLEVAEIFGAAKISNAKQLAAKGMDAAFARTLGLPGLTVEGYLFPDTYKLAAGTDPEKVLVTLVRRHREVYEELRAKHADDLAALGKLLQWGDAEVVTMASIVEKETGQPHERPRIAQVFINRLTLPTFTPRLLQTDPTIVYGCTVAPKFLGKSSDACSKFSDRIRRIHLDDKDNPYSTYAHEGLPPAPISNPGREALEAVMKPDGTNYLYFVSRNDGTHVFAASRADHEANVVKFQRGGKALPHSAVP